MSEPPDSLIRLLHVLRPAEGGMRRHLELLCPRLRERGIGSTVAAPAGFAPQLIATIVPASITDRPHVFHDLQAAAAVARCARDADLLHGHGLRGVWIARLAARLSRRPFVFTAHNLAPQRPSRLAVALMRSVARKASAVIAVSRAIARTLRVFGLAADSVTIVPNGIDLAPFDVPSGAAALRRALSLESDTRVIASAGRLSPEKGFNVLAEAAPSILSHREDVRLVVAGVGPDTERIRQRARELGIEDRFLLPGRVDDIPGLFSLAQIVVVPSLSEGQGIVALEGMAARRPIAATDTGGLPETVIGGETGVLVPPGDPDALATALIGLLDDAGARSRMGEAGRARVEALFTADRMADGVAAVYRTVL